MKLQGIKQIMVAATLVLVTAIAGQAQAFNFNDGDLVLAIYGNNKEALYNLGSASTRLATGASFDFNAMPGLQAAGVGTNPVKYSVFGFDGTNLSVYGGTTSTPGGIDPTRLILTQELNSAAIMQGQISAVGGLPGDTIDKSDPNSFSSQMDQAGSGNFNGAWPVAFQGAPGEVLNIIKGQNDANGVGTFTQVGRMLLRADGSLTIGNPGPGGAPVPLPAAVVLFGTGVIGLAGLARQSVKQMVA